VWPRSRDDLQDADGVAVFTYSEAQTKARKCWKSAERASLGLAPDDGPYMVADALEAYFADREQRGSKGLAKDRAAARARVLPQLGPVELAKLTTKRIRDWQSVLATAPKLTRASRTAKDRKSRAVDMKDADAVRARRATANRTLTVLKAALNHADAGSGAGAAGYGVLFQSRPLVIFGLCAMLFHFANAPLLPLVGQKLAAAYPKEATAMMSACIVAAQLVMLPIALLVGRKADVWGRKPLFLAGFVILPIRAVLYTLSDNSFWLIGVQILDGVGAGIFGALTPLVIADIMRGTGRYNLAQGAIATMVGIGASLSGLAAGEVVDHFGYTVAFLTLGAAALVAAIVFALGMPETAESAIAA
jgi:Major Facilitator Superfamily